MDVSNQFLIVNNILYKINVIRLLRMKIVFGTKFISNAILKVVKMKFQKIKNVPSTIQTAQKQNTLVETQFVKITKKIMIKVVD